MNRSYNHIKHFVDTNAVVNSRRHRPGECHKLTWHRDSVKQSANQLDDKQRHTRFDYYEHDMSKFGTPSWAQSSLDRSTNSFNFQEHLEDPEYNQARHQAVHSHCRDETCCSQRDPGNFQSWHYPGS